MLNPVVIAVAVFLIGLSTSSKSPELIRLQNGYLRTRATLTAPKHSTTKSADLVPNSREAQLVGGNQGHLINLDTINDTISDELDEDSTDDINSDPNEPLEPDLNHQQLSFSKLPPASRLVIKTQAIYPIEFEHLGNEEENQQSTSQSSGYSSKKAAKKNKDKIPAYKIQSRGSKNPMFAPGHKYNASSTQFSEALNISRVLEKLLFNYDSNQRPGHGQDAPSMITSNIHIRSMGPMSELNMEYSLDCYFRQRWVDTRLEYDTNQPFLTLNINMLEKIWKPDTYFHNGKGSYLHTITRPNKFLRIYKNGEVYYSMRLTIKARCPMQLQNFPMDKQSCPLLFGSYGYTNDQLRYQWDPKDPVSLNEELVMSQFDLITPIFYRNVTVFFNRAKYSILQVNFNLIRHTGYFLIQVYVPCALIVVLSWVSFWINREATADRVGLGITTVLTLSTFGMDTRTDLPKVSYPTALDWFVIMCFSFVSSTLLEFATVHYFTKIGFGEVPFVEGWDNVVTGHGADEWTDEEVEESLQLTTATARNRVLTRAQSAREPNNGALHIITPPKAFTGDATGPRSRLETKYYTATAVSQGYGLPQTLLEQQAAQLYGDYCPQHDRFVEPAAGLTREVLANCTTPSGGIIYGQPIGVDGQPLGVHDECDDEYEDYESDSSGTEYGSGPAIGLSGKSKLNQLGRHHAKKHWTACCWSSVAISVPRCCRQFWHCIIGSEVYRQKMRKRARGRGGANSVSLIDKTSRIMFPLSFILLNLFYWLSYGHDRNSPFASWKDGQAMGLMGQPIPAALRANVSNALL